jgi:hypothetical protein
MAWYNGGNWGGLPIARGNKLLAELCTAVNERETAIGISQTDWRLGVGTLYEPAYTDFGGVRVASKAQAAGKPGVKDTLAALQAAIERLLDPGVVLPTKWFYDYDTGEEWTLSALRTAVGYGDAWLDVDRPQNIDVWLQIRGCLDRLRYLHSTARVDFEYNDISFATDIGDYGWYVGKGTIQNAWDESVDSITSSPMVYPSWSPENYRPVISYLPGAPVGDVLVTSSVRAQFEFSPLVGAPRRGFFTWKDIQVNSNFSSADPVILTGGGLTLELSAGENAEVVREWIVDLTGQTSPYNVNLTWSPPADHPFGEVTGAGPRECTRRVQSLGATGLVLSELVIGTDLTYG